MSRLSESSRHSAGESTCSQFSDSGGTAQFYNDTLKWCQIYTHFPAVCARRSVKGKKGKCSSLDIAPLTDWTAALYNLGSGSWLTLAIVPRYHWRYISFLGTMYIATVKRASSSSTTTSLAECSVVMVYEVMMLYKLPKQVYELVVTTPSLYQ